MVLDTVAIMAGLCLLAVLKLLFQSGATRGCFATNEASSWDSHRSAVQLRSAITFLTWLKNYSSCDFVTEFIYSGK